MKKNTSNQDEDPFDALRKKQEEANQLVESLKQKAGLEPVEENQEEKDQNTKPPDNFDRIIGCGG